MSDASPLSHFFILRFFSLASLFLLEILLRLYQIIISFYLYAQPLELDAQKRHGSRYYNDFHV